MNRKTIALLMFGGIWWSFMFDGGPTMAAEPQEAVERANAAKLNPTFDPQSFWYAPIPDHVILHPDSNELVAAFQRQKAAIKDHIVGINTECFACPIYIADKNTPPIGVGVDHCAEMGEGADFKGLASQFGAVPMPAFAQPACGDDSEMAIFQPSTDTMWEFWRAKKNDKGGWQACWGGRLDKVQKVQESGQTHSV